MDSSFNADKPDDDLLTAFGTGILTERDTIPEGFANTPSSRTDIPIEVIGGGRYLRVDQSANLRANSATSKIWNHGFEYRSLDHGLRDKYWRYKYYNKLLKVTGAGNINTSHAIRYLKKKHSISFGRDREEEDKEEDEEDDGKDNILPDGVPSIFASRTILDLFTSISAIISHAAREGFKALILVIDADKFRWMLIK
jgi:hypothetical protein